MTTVPKSKLRNHKQYMMQVKESYLGKQPIENSKKGGINLMFMGPCIIFIVE